MTPSFHAPRSFDPSYSLLGRAFRAWTGDRLRGEALYIVALTGLALVLLMTHYLGWALLQPLFTAHPAWQTGFWVAQTVFVLLWGGLGLVGFRPSVTVACTPSALRLTQGPRVHTVPYDDIDEVKTVPAATFHRHYRRYAATTIFVSRLPDAVLLLRTPDGPVVVALPEAEAQETLRHHLDTTAQEAPDPVPQA